MYPTVAQLGECLTENQKVDSSNLSRGTFFYVHILYLSHHLYETLRSSVGRASDCRSESRRFESSSRDIYFFIFLSVMSVYVPPEIQEIVFSYLMYSSGKGFEFKMQILNSWFKINLKRVDRALDTLSQVNYHREMVKLFLDIDDLPHLTDDMRLTFHKEIVDLHFRKKEKLNKARTWVVGYYNITRSAVNFMNQILSFLGHFMTCVVNDDNALFGYLLLKEELHKTNFQDLLSVSKYSDLNLFPASFNCYKN